MERSVDEGVRATARGNTCDATTRKNSADGTARVSGPEREYEGAA